MAETYNDKVPSLEEVVSDIGVIGPYHFKLFVFLIFLSMSSEWHAVNYIFATEIVGYRCKYKECTSGVVSLANQTIDYACSKYEINRNTCAVTNRNVFTKCDEWEYEKPNSFVAEFDLACEDWKRTLIGTLHSAGYITGLLFIGLISDKLGRKSLIIFTSVAGGVIGLAKSFVTVYWLYALLEYVEPLIGDCYSATFVMAIEMVTKEHRSLAISILSFSMCLGGTTKALIAWLVPNWRNYLRAIYAPSLLFILYIFIMDESFRWLLNKGKHDRLKELILKAAKTNNVSIDEKRIDHIKCETQTKVSQITLLKMTFSSRKLLLRLLCCIFMWFSSLFGAYVMVINSVSLEGNKYLNYGLLSLSDIPASIIVYFLLEKCKRKIPIILMLILASVFCMGNTFIPVDHPCLGTVFYILGKMCIVIALRIVYLYTSELFPTYTRNTMHAWCSAIGRTAALLAPQTPLLIQYWAGLPSLLVGILSLLTAFVVTLMPDTSDDVLPENIKQAECLGKKEKETDVYCISSQM